MSIFFRMKRSVVVTTAALAVITGLLVNGGPATAQPAEVGEAGVRVRKLDVAWVGPGYRYALSACDTAHNGIEQYSNARGFAWMVEGWAGAQRCAVQWTGDHSGSLDAIKWQIPAITGSGNSGIAYSAGDVDGIFAGSATSYVRDMQWKVFNPESPFRGQRPSVWVGAPYFGRRTHHLGR